MSKFVPNKEHSRTALIFLFSFEEKLLLNYTDCFEKLIVNMLHRKIHVNDSFGVSKVEILMLQTRNTENYQKGTKMQNCKHCWTKTMHKHKNNSQVIDLNRSLLKKRPEYQKRQHKIIFLHDNAP